MEEMLSPLSSMAWKRLQQYSCGRLIPQNSMFSNFCHVLKIALHHMMEAGIALKRPMQQWRQNLKLTTPDIISLHETQFLEFTFQFYGMT